MSNNLTRDAYVMILILCIISRSTSGGGGFMNYPTLLVVEVM